jgi:hypothetical protein
LACSCAVASPSTADVGLGELRPAAHVGAAAGAGPGRVRVLWGSARLDFARSGVRARLLLLGALGWIAYEWGPGNEVVAPYLAAHAIPWVGGLHGVALTGLLIGGFTAAQQVAAGLTAAAALSQFGGLASTAFDLFGSDENGAAKRERYATLPRRLQLVYAFFLGSTFAAVREATVVGRSDFGVLVRPVMRAAFLVGLATAVIAGGFDALYHLALGTALEPAARTVVTTAQSLWFWIAVLVIVAVASVVRRRVATARPTTSIARDGTSSATDGLG